MYLQKPSGSYRSRNTCSEEALVKSIRKGDVLLVDGASRISKAIKYMTQSSWSHAALCIESHNENATADTIFLIEADVVKGVQIVPLRQFINQDTRICRPVGLRATDIERVVGTAKLKLGHQYDKKNVIDLARYLIQTPPIPVKWRRTMLSIGSGDPTRAICSTLVAQAYQSIQYPILPDVYVDEPDSENKAALKRYFHARHHSLFVPRDFDLSPYFCVVKPTLEHNFDPYQFVWTTPLESAEDGIQSDDLFATNSHNKVEH